MSGKQFIDDLPRPQITGLNRRKFAELGHCEAVLRSGVNQAVVFARPLRPPAPRFRISGAGDGIADFAFRNFTSTPRDGAGNYGLRRFFIAAIFQLKRCPIQKSMNISPRSWAMVDFS
jgi:hypothetical protein